MRIPAAVPPPPARRGDLLAEQAGLILGFRAREETDGLWPREALEAALLIAAGPT